MSYNIVKSLVDGEVIDQYDAVDGINPAVEIVVNGVYETGVTAGVTDFTGYATFVAGDDSCMIPFHKHNAGLVAGTKIGSADFSTTKGTASKINVYVESGELKIQNKTAASISLSVRF